MSSGAQLSLGRWADRKSLPPVARKTKPRDRRPRRIESWQEELDLWDVPQTRGDCVNGVRPCPWVRCRYHLLLETTEAASLKINGHEDRVLPHDAGHEAAIDWEDGAVERLFEMRQTCALDVADQAREGGEILSVRRLAPLVGIHFSKVAVCEQDAHAKFRERSGDNDVRDMIEAWAGVEQINSKKE